MHFSIETKFGVPFHVYVLQGEGKNRFCKQLLFVAHTRI